LYGRDGGISPDTETGAMSQGEVECENTAVLGAKEKCKALAKPKVEKKRAGKMKKAGAKSTLKVAARQSGESEEWETFDLRGFTSDDSDMLL